MTGPASPESRAIGARDRLRERAQALEPSSGTPPPAPAPTPCDGYFAAALSFFALAAQADDPQTFLSLYQTGESYLHLGQACQRQLGGHSDT